MQIEKFGSATGERTITKYDYARDEQYMEREQIEIPAAVHLEFGPDEFKAEWHGDRLRLVLTGEKMLELLEKY